MSMTQGTPARQDLYPSYAVVLKDDVGRVYYSPCAQDEKLTIRAFYTLARIPSTKTIVVRCAKNATDQDRALVQKAINSGRIREVLHQAESIGATWRKRQEDGTWIFYGRFGSKLNDPLIDLELSMMLNAGSDLMTFEQVADAYPQLWVSDLFRMGYTHGPGGEWLWTRSIIEAWVAQNGIEA